MSLSKYITFMEVAKTESLSQAAARLHQTVPGVSYTIARLEEEWGVPLLVRNHNRIRLTPMARQLMPYVSDILKGQEHLEQALGAIKGIETGTVCVGGVSWALKRWLPPIMKLMKENYPNIEIKINMERYEGLKKLLLDGTMDVAFGQEGNSKMLNFEPLLEDPYVVAVHTEHPLAGCSCVSLAELEGEKLIVPDWSYDKGLSNLIEKSGIKDQIAWKITDVGMMLSMAANQIGVAIIPRLLIENPWEISVVPLKDWPPKHFGIITSAITQPSPAAKKFIEYVRKATVNGVNCSTKICERQ